ncbi:MAG: DEAD/DEAH box helicase [Candidatus Marinimicrobia bacterium]|nr:DEAD/DEAH box helicase [Candidatus Neomarinimicrobiota bacterium]
MRRKIGIIDGNPKETKGKLFYPVSVDPSQPSPYYPEDSLEKFIPPKSVEQQLKEKEFSDVECFIQSLIYKKLEKPLSDNLYTFYASRTEFQVHQFKPVLKLLNTFKQRLLLADEVGLGKTIEAGIIITELSARLGELSRVLIVCPSMLLSKWEREMQKRFSLNFDILTRNDFIKFLQRYIEYGEAEKMKGIISLQTLRSNKMIERLREVSPHFDIVIVDEAHYMRNPETLSSELGEVLSELSDAMLFLSATPLQLGTPDLFNLLSLLIPEEFSDFLLFHRLIEPNEYINNALRRLYDPKAALELLKKVEETSQREKFIKNSFYREAIDLLSRNNNLTRDQAIRLQKLLIELNCLSYVFTRTKKRDVEIQFPIREARVIRVQFTPEEMEFYNAITDFVSERFTAKYGSSQGISFAVIMPQRQVASCIQAMKERLDNIIKKRAIKTSSGDNGDVIDLSMNIDSSWKLESGEIASLSKLKKIAQKVGDTDTKFNMFVEALRKLDKEDPNAKIMVFAFFKKTLEYLMKRLTSTEYRGKVALIHGDIHPKDRGKIIKKFRQTNEIKILLSSEVGGEGLDFEFCNVIFNYDLPWNPMRVEQRIGRLDRYGQQHEKILIYNFSMVGTIDDEILNRLYRRINVFERYIGDLDAILGDQITELTKEIFNTKLTYEQKVQKIEKIAENIERRQKELEEFEKECQKFIGQDEYFNQEVTRILETKRFITSDEVLFLLKFFLKTNFPKSTLHPPKRGRDNVFVLKCDEGFRRFVRQYASSTENIKEIERKMSFDGGFLVTFSDQEACRDDSLEFITIHHPIMKAIKRFYDENKQQIHATAQFSLRGDNKYHGNYLFFIYLLEKTALKKDLILIPILVNLANEKVHIVDELCDWFLGEIVQAQPLNDEYLATYETKDFERIFKEAGEYLEMIREEEEQKLKRRNDTLVNNQIESVRQSATIKIKKAEEIIRKLKEQGKSDKDPIIRLHNGRIRNFKISMEEKIKELELKRAVSVGFNLIAGGVVKIM